MLPYEQILDGVASLPVLYLDGNSYVQQTESTLPWVTGTTTASINTITEGHGILEDAGEDKYISYWLLATNDSNTPIKLLLGRFAFDSVDNAYGETFQSYGLDMAENVPMYHLVLRTSSAFTNIPKVRIEGRLPNSRLR